MPDIEPKNREEIFLKNITRTLGGYDPVEIEPHNRQEHFLHNIAVALGADGVATDLEPNKRIEYLYKNIESIASANRNRVQVIESTMANPLGDIYPAELIPKLTNPYEDEIPSGATGFLSIDGTALGVGEAFGFIYASGSTGLQTNGAAMYADSATCFGADWGYGDITPTVNWIFMGQIPGDGTGAVVDVSAYAENLPTKLTIVWHDLNGGAGGGGNPNRVQTIEGTLANPWGDMTHEQIEELLEALPDHNGWEDADNATAFIRLDGTAIGVSSGYGYFWRLDIEEFVSDGLAGDESTMTGYLAQWVVSNESAYVAFCKMYQVAGDGTGSATDMTAYASLIPTTLTIIWHPLPE